MPCSTREDSQVIILTLKWSLDGVLLISLSRFRRGTGACKSPSNYVRDNLKPHARKQRTSTVAGDRHRESRYGVSTCCVRACAAPGADRVRRYGAAGIQSRGRQDQRSERTDGVQSRQGRRHYPGLCAQHPRVHVRRGAPPDELADRFRLRAPRRAARQYRVPPQARRRQVHL